jgi:predicted metal-dependent phosphoesterase TrpH
MANPVRDLHVHSNCSDGLYAPPELVEQAALSGVEELSLTDHDTIAGLDEAQGRAKSLGVRFMPGFELTCRSGQQTVHVLGYGFHPAAAGSDRALSQYLAQVRTRDHAWARQMCRRSQEKPMVVNPPGEAEIALYVREEEIGWARGTIPSPFHVAVVLARKLAAISDELDIPPRHCMYLFTGRPEQERRGESYWPALRERYAPVLDRYGLVARAHWWIPRPTAELLDVSEAIRTIERIGGIAVLAHPGEQGLTGATIEQLVELGIRGIEVYTFKHSATYVSELECLAGSLGVFATSGSDFHDPHHRAQVQLGRDRSGRRLTKGLSLDGFRAFGAYIAG